MQRFKTQGKLLLLAACCVASLNAAVIRVSEAAFVAGSGLITFSEPGFPVDTLNPTYTPADYGGGAGSPTVTFEGYFVGQALGTPATCPPGAALTGCVVGSPTGPLTLDAAAPNTFITTDGSFPTSPTLSGTPRFNGPISLLFNVDVAGVGLEGGFFNAAGGTAITAYDRAGNVLGSVLNVGTGIEFLGLVTPDGTAQIAGLQFSLVGSEPAGFNIDNVRFGIAGQVEVPGGDIPEPSTITLSAAGLLVVGLVARRRRK
jgi:hypothetical protein